jgi:hypothetical protein
MWMVRALLLLANTKQTLPLIGCSVLHWLREDDIDQFCTKFAISFGFAALRNKRNFSKLISLLFGKIAIRIRLDPIIFGN